MGNGTFSDIALEIAKKKKLADTVFVDEGAFKETYSAKNKNSVKVALKIMDPNKCDLCRTDREIDAMKRCNSSYIAKLLDYGQINFQGIDYLFIIEEFLDGGTLSDKFQNSFLSPSNIRGYGLQLSQGIGHLKELNLVHRDIKPDNIMFHQSSDVPLFVDFGLVRDLSKSSLTQSWNQLGPCTPFFAAPEQLNNDKKLIGWRTDQFDLGLVLGYCLTGRHPYQARNMTKNQAIQAVANKQNCSDEFKALAESANLECLLKMIEPWPVRRYSDPQYLLEGFRKRI